MDAINNLGKKINECGMKYVSFIYSIVDNKTKTDQTSQTTDPIWNKVVNSIEEVPDTKITNVVHNSSFDVITSDDSFQKIERSLNSIENCRRLSASAAIFQKNQTFLCVGSMNDFLVNIVNRKIN